MQVVQLTQGSDEWLAWRKEGITATDAIIIGGDIVGIPYYPNESVWRLWAEKTGYAVKEDLSSNPLVRHGRRFEAQARSTAQAVLNDLLIPICVQSDVDPMVRASLDGITSKNEPVEIKCPTDPIWKEIRLMGRQSPTFKRYWIQLQHQMLTCGSKTGYLCFYREGELLDFKVDLDRKFLNELYKKEKDLWSKIKKGVEPEKDFGRDKYIPKDEAAKEWLYLSEQYKSIHDEISRLNKLKEELEAKLSPLKDELVTKMGRYYSCDYGGLLVTKYRRSGSVQMNELVQHIQSIDPEFSDASLDLFRNEATEHVKVTRTENDMPKNIIAPSIAACVDAGKQFASAVF